MSISMYQASVPVFIKNLGNLSAILDKAIAFAAAKKVDHATILNWRVTPDMLTFQRQIWIAADFAKGASARLAGVEVPAWEDNEKTLQDMQARIAKTIEFCKSLPAAKIDGSEERAIEIKMGGNPVTFKGQPYLLNYAFPNFFFHMTTTYLILRQMGVEIGKKDFIGSV